MRGLFGGGFFFRPFNFTGVYEVALASSGVPGVPGAWFQIVDPTPPGRWMQLILHNPTAGATLFLVQLGLGALAAEVVWQPVGGLGAFRANFNAPGVEAHWDYSFPISLLPGQRLVARTVTGVALVDWVTITACIWD